MPNSLPLSKMTELIRERKLGPVELMTAHLDHIERENPKLNAFAILLADQAREAAQRAENGLPLGPLHGIPVTVKDSFDVAGLPTRLGSMFTSSTPAAVDATLVARLKRAGAIVLGKTNVPEFLASYESDNFITGRTNNPWDLERTPGGSSGGEAAAIAARMSPAGIGSDGGGSIRIPAHFCGIAGLKPTPGRCPATGHQPDVLNPQGLISVTGPMARTVKDLSLLFRVLAGHDPLDPFSAPVSIGSAPKLKRVGVVEGMNGVAVDPSIARALTKAVSLLSDHGIATDEFGWKGFSTAPNLWAFFFGELPTEGRRQMIAGREAEAHWTLLENLKREPPPASAQQVVEGLMERDRMRRALIRQMEGIDALIMPPASIPAFRHRARKWEISGAPKPIGLFQAMMPSTTFNFLGFPALVLPMGMTEDGLPVGVQIVGRPWEEETLLAIGERIEEARGEFAGPALD